jgi:RecA/RadA recombinase
MSFQDVKDKLMKAATGSNIFILSETDQQKDVISTKSHDLNRILSGSLYKTLPTRTLTFLVGPETSGKSSFMCLCLAAAQRIGYTPVVFDAEQAWTPEFCRRWGLNPEEALIVQSSWVEDIMLKLAEIIDSGVTNLAISLDSIGALESKKVLEDARKGDIKADQGTLQKKIKRLLKLMVAVVKMQNSFGFMAGHYYGDPSGYGNSEKIGGGFYPKLASDVIVLLKKDKLWENPRGKTIAEKGKIIGTEIKAATNKNRYYPPFQEATVNIDYQKGINPMAGIIEMAEDMGLIQTGGSWLSCDLLGLKVQGRVNFLEQLYKMDYTPLLDQIEEVLKDSGYSTYKEEIEELEKEQSLPSGENEKELLFDTPGVRTEETEINETPVDTKQSKPIKTTRKVGKK